MVFDNANGILLWKRNHAVPKYMEQNLNETKRFEFERNLKRNANALLYEGLEKQPRPDLQLSERPESLSLYHESLIGAL